ncbi:hypothetical protein QYF36_006770 [Acer negundo]|nr:hypothetical protein QYF36_006770 [Acer negundo]
MPSQALNFNIIIVAPIGLAVNNEKLVIGNIRRNVSRVESEEDSSWTSTEEESGELVRRNFNRWKGDCSKSVGPVHYLDLAHEKGLSMDPQPELSQGQAEGLTSPTDSEVQLHDADYLADGLKSNVVGLQVNNPKVGQMVVYT